MFNGILKISWSNSDFSATEQPAWSRLCSSWSGSISNLGRVRWNLLPKDDRFACYSHVYRRSQLSEVFPCLHVFFLERHTDICPACAYFGVAFAGSFRVTAMNPSEENDFSGWQMPFPFELPWHFAEIGGDGWAQKDGPQNFRINSRHTNGYQTWRSQHYQTYCIFTGESGHTVPVLVV